MKRWLPVLATVLAAAPPLSSCAQPSMPTPAPLPTEPTEPPAEETRGKTIVVTNAADSGPGTLRQALLDAQNGDTITFDPAVFSPSAPFTISLTSSLPLISQGNLKIDASNASFRQQASLGAEREVVFGCRSQLLRRNGLPARF